MTLDELVRTYKANKGDTTLHGYITLLHYAIWGLKRIKPKLALNTVTERLQINSAKQAVLPDDYLKWVSLSLLQGDRLTELIYDASIAPPQFTDRQPFNTNYSTNRTFETEFEFLVAQFEPDNIKREYGDGEGYFMINEESGLIQLDARIDFDYVYLTYISNNFKPNTATEVHELVGRSLIEYMRWQEARYQMGDASAEAQYRKQEYLYAVDDCNADMSNLHSQLIIDIMNRYTTRSPLRNV